MRPIVNLYKLGRLPYAEAFKIQQVLFDNLKQHVTSSSSEYGRVDESSVSQGAASSLDVLRHDSRSSNQVNNSLLLVEHEPVYTIGIRSKQYNEAYVADLKERLVANNLKAAFVPTNRGGLITFHGPGQLVAYPILKLGDFSHTVKNRSVKTYVKLLENTIIDTLGYVGVKGAHTVDQYPGVWLDDGERKIAFIGITCKRFVTMHGISINCNCDLAWFEHIVSCGIEDKSITSIRQELQLIKQGCQSNETSQPLGEDARHYQGRQIVDRNGSSHIEPSKPMTGNGGINSLRDDLGYVSEAFCQSFSYHFQCHLVEKELC